MTVSSGKKSAGAVELLLMTRRALEDRLRRGARHNKPPCPYGARELKKKFCLRGGLVPESGYNGYNGYKGEKWLKNAEKGAKNGQKDAKTGVLRRILVKWCNRLRSQSGYKKDVPGVLGLSQPLG
jgi:hypothetical protein